MPDAPHDFALAAIAGPIQGSFPIRGDRPLSIGRAAGSAICLVHEGVSRRHASLVPRDGAWHVIDHNSTGGTFLNAVRLEPGRATPISTGDLLKFGPCAFRVGAPATAPGAGTSILGTLVDAPSDPASRRVERTSTPAAEPALERVSGLARSDRRLRLLSDGLARLTRAADDLQLARTALDIALAGSGYRWGAVLRPGIPEVPAEGSPGVCLERIEVVATSTPCAGAADFAFSRSLVRRASAGEVVILTEDRLPDLQADQIGHSIADMRIHSALCAPVFLGEVVEAFLYLDSRGDSRAVSDDALGFCDAVARAYGLAAANLKRADLQRRHSRLQVDLDAAREAQQMILPPPRASLPFLTYAATSIPGQFIAGDFFNVLELPGDDGVAVCLGDVAGHGVASALVMSALQAHLHAHLAATGDPLAAVDALNRYLALRAAAGRFASLWVGVFRPDGRVRFVDAGHGHWLCHRRSATPEPPPSRAGGAPVGISEALNYRADEITLHPGDRLVLYSDGIVEQRGSDGAPFDLPRLLDAVAAPGSPADVVDRLFTAVSAHAGISGNVGFDDDASAAVIEFASR